MPDTWIPLPLDKPLFANLTEDAVVGFQTAIENGYLNELGGHSRFPGMTLRADFGGNARVYLHDFNGDLIAADSKGKVRRIDRSYNVTDVTAVPVAGGRRVVFAKTDRELLMAAGGPIVRLRAATTELLSSEAPLATHIAWIDNFTIAVEINSGRFFHSPPGEAETWDPLDTFAADGNPDNINSLLVTPFRELILGGEDSIEQFDRSNDPDVPFARAWAIGAGGVKLPYAIVFVDNATWTINSRTELVSMIGQVPTVQSDAIGRLLEAVDDWSDAWMTGPLLTAGQKFILLQAPNATNAYDTKGVTLLFDYRTKRFSTLYGWNATAGVPARYPAWSHWHLWGKTFIGGEGKLYELTDTTHRNGTETQRWLIRTSHMSKGSGVIVKALRLRVVRGTGTSATPAKIRVRCSRDGKPLGNWVTRTLGAPGQRSQFLEFGGFGAASTFQWEMSCTDDAAVDLIGADIKADPIGH